MSSYYRTLIQYVVPPLFTGLVDTFPCNKCFSLRKLKAVSTKAIRVRRSSDNAELDIGFVGENLDTSSLMTFVGSGNGFITIWYDQSGNGYNYGQSNVSYQPYIVNAGTLYTSGGKPAIRFDNTKHLLLQSTTCVYPTAGQNYVATFMVVNADDSTGGSAGVLYSGRTSTGIARDSYQNKTENPTNRTLYHTFSPSGNIGGGGVQQVLFRGGTTDVYKGHNQLNMVMRVNSGYTSTFYKNGTSFLTSTTGSNTSFPNTNIYYACIGGSSLYEDGYASNWYGSMCELLFYSDDKFSTYSTLNSNQKTYWGTP